MQYDILLPNGNEKELAEQAKAFNIIPIFLYPFKDKKEIAKKKSELSRAKINAKVGVYIKPKYPAELKKIGKLCLDADFLAVINPGELVRLAVSNPKFDAVFEVPEVFGSDKPEYRKSNFNVVLANLAKENNVAYGISFSYLLENSGNSRAKLMGREMQNIRICRRKIPILMASLAQNPWQMRMPENLSVVARILGLNSPQSKAAVSSATESILKTKEKRRSGKLIMPGVELLD